MGWYYVNKLLEMKGCKQLYPFSILSIPLLMKNSNTDLKDSKMEGIYKKKQVYRTTKPSIEDNKINYLTKKYH